MASKQQIKEKENALIEMVCDYCKENIDDEYAELGEKLVKKLGRKRDVPFQRGKLEIWAAAVIHALGSVNFLFDKSFEPYVTAQEICDYFETKKTTVSNKARQIRDTLKMTPFDSDFSTQEVADRNPLNEMVMVDGFIVPLEELPEDAQRLVRETRARGEDIEFRTE